MSFCQFHNRERIFDEYTGVDFCSVCRAEAMQDERDEYLDGLRE